MRHEVNQLVESILQCDVLFGHLSCFEAVQFSLDRVHEQRLLVSADTEEVHGAWAVGIERAQNALVLKISEELVILSVEFSQELLSHGFVSGFVLLFVSELGVGVHVIVIIVECVNCSGFVALSGLEIFDEAFSGLFLSWILSCLLVQAHSSRAES